ncbi:hypothetical protein HYQ45_006350 [Verticillium longisporum]|uniref:Ecp2 effector protein-like domain-containing protein n=1 Tax=Verticillium longisporum TaxID=100787 RepID=A0A8I2ZR81_VERLO|nr:hypothetical protein HYQ45_006350 [Verticillium longisporum]
MLNMMSPLMTLVAILALLPQGQGLVIPGFLNLTSLAPVLTQPRDFTILPYPLHRTTSKTTTFMTQTTPTSQPQPQPQPQPRRPPSHGNNICGPSSFVPHTSSLSPLAADCLALAAALRAKKGYFVARGFTDTTTLVGLATEGSCIFDVRPAMPSHFHGVIGALDAAAFLDDAVRDLSSPAGGATAGDGSWVAGGLVGASGVTACELGGGGKQALVWAVYAAGQKWHVGHVDVPVEVPGAGCAMEMGRWGVVAMLASLAVLL